MATRTTRRQVTFHHSFKLSALERPQPAGTYTLETDEEQIDGLSFNAFHRLTTILYLPAGFVTGRAYQAVQVDPEELAAALANDDSGALPEQPPSS